MEPPTPPTGGDESGPLDGVVDRFRAVVARPDEEIPLDEAALLIAAADRPVDVAAQLARLDALAAQVREPTLDGVLRLLFGDLGFAGDRLDYHNPANSHLDRVLDRRRGLPITLSVVLMEVGRRVGVPLWGVSMPGHFLVRDKVDPEVFVDAFARGAVLDRRGCRVRFHSVQGHGARFDESYLEPAPRVAIVARMIANLESVAATTRDHGAQATLLRLRAAFPGAGEAERRDLAAVEAVRDRVN